MRFAKMPPRDRVGGPVPRSGEKPEVGRPEGDATPLIRVDAARPRLKEETGMTRDLDYRSILSAASSRRTLFRQAAAVSAGMAGMTAWAARPGAAQEDLRCPPPAVRTPAGTPQAKSGKKIGVSVAYLAVPFYANFKTGLEDGANHFGFDYDLRDGGGGDLAVEVANIQDFIAQKYDAILLTPSGAGIVPAIKEANDAGIPVIEVNNRAGFGSEDVEVVTYVGADDVDYGRQQGNLLLQVFAGQPAKVGYILGIAGTSPQIMRSEGFKDAIKDNPEIEIVAEVSGDFDAQKALAATQDLLTRFPKGELDVIVVQGPEGVTGADFARKNGREEVKFIVGDYDALVRVAIMDGYVTGTVNQDPYPQAFEGMHMAWLYLNGQEADIPKPLFMELPIITQENAEATPPSWGC
jgi:ribose transport system substrate-binding protein